MKILFDPKIIAYISAIYIGRPDIADDLIAICKRESRCRNVKTHAIDNWISNKEWHGQKSWGHINPKCQKRKAKGGWATHGAWGLSAGAHWSYVPKCYQPDVFDNPWISGIVAAKKYVKSCWSERNRSGWCRIRKTYLKNNKKVDKKEKITYKRPKNWFEFFLLPKK